MLLPIQAYLLIKLIYIFLIREGKMFTNVSNKIEKIIGRLNEIFIQNIKKLLNNVSPKNKKTKKK
jgi:hypothetical protein